MLLPFMCKLKQLKNVLNGLGGYCLNIETEMEIVIAFCGEEV